MTRTQALLMQLANENIEVINEGANYGISTDTPIKEVLANVANMGLKIGDNYKGLTIVNMPEVFTLDTRYTQNTYF